MTSLTDYVLNLTSLYQDAAALPPPAPANTDLSPPRTDAPTALIFSPHPDDECITGTLPLRLRRELGWRVVNVAVTQGSNRARQAGRWQELTDACAFLGWETIQTAPGGLEGITPKTRDANPIAWAAAVAVIRDILLRFRPAAVFLPHAKDWNGTHIGTHLLVLDALRADGPDFSCRLVYTEFWSAMDNPNLLVESTPEQTAALVTALALHTGEVARNPYHLRLPAWMIDNVRRGAELVGGQGGAAPSFLFGTLYRLEHWTGNAAEPALPAGRFLPAGPDALRDLFVP